LLCFRKKKKKTTTTKLSDYFFLIGERERERERERETFSDKQQISSKTVHDRPFQWISITSSLYPDGH
jgi:hypothetical protein